MFILSSSIIACNNNNNTYDADTLSLPEKEFENGIAKADIQILDVRTMQEYQSGHIKNALQADWTNMDEFIYRTQSLDKSKPVYAYCLSGARSAKAAQWLKEKGYKVYNLESGIAAWKREGKPLEGVSDVKHLCRNIKIQFPPIKLFWLISVPNGARPAKKWNPL